MKSPFEIEQIDEVLSTARSVRRKLDFDRPVARQTLFECINVAVQAPTGVAGENWRFVIVDEDYKKAEVAQIYKEVLIQLLSDRGMEMKPSHKALTDRLHEIPAMIFVCVEGRPMDESVSAQVAYYGSILPAAWSLMLALRARHIGTTWTTLLSSRQADVAHILGMPDDCLQTVMLPVGYMKGAVLRRAERQQAEQVTFVNAWGARGEG